MLKRRRHHRTNYSIIAISFAHRKIMEYLQPPMFPAKRSSSTSQVVSTSTLPTTQQGKWSYLQSIQ